MKKKLISVLLCAAMVGTMFAGCGKKESKDGGSGEGGSSDKIALDIIISQYGNFTKDWFWAAAAYYFTLR